MSLKPGQPAPEFSTEALVNGEIKQVKLADFKGHYVVLFFYPADLCAHILPSPIASSPHVRYARDQGWRNLQKYLIDENSFSR